jgi:two-component system LytT family sensor kinase
MNPKKPVAEKSQNNDVLAAILTGKKFRIVRHGIFLLFFALQLFNSNEQKDFKGIYQIYANIIFIATLIASFYINMYILIPKTLYRKKYSAYLLYLILTVLGVFIILITFSDWIFAPYKLKPDDGNSLLTKTLLTISFLILFILPSTALKVFQRWIADSNRIYELEKRAMESELKALKNQINPHFLFNMLNNVNVLIATDPVKAQSVVHKLSGFLRYYLYENVDDFVFLPVEVNFINDYLNIEKLRRDDFAFKIVNRFSRTSGIKVPSNLLMTFVENAVKHGSNPGSSQRIRISVSTTKTHFVFTCVNGKPDNPRVSKLLGVGLNNVSRRLDLQYAGRHDLEINDLKTVYKVSLKLPI